MVDLSSIIARLTGFAHTHDGPYLVRSEPGDEPQITQWDESVLGPMPTKEQMAAMELTMAIEVRTAAVQADKCRVRDAGFSAGGIHYDSDQSARTAYLELALEIATDPDYATRWKASEGVWVTMDAAVFAQVKLAGTAHVQACFAWQAARDAELAAIQAAVDAGTMPIADALAAVAAVPAAYEGMS